MKYREYELLPYKLFGDSGTTRVDINVTDWITELLVECRVKNHDTETCPDYPPCRVITKLEIVDGGQVYWSLTGQEAMAAYVYNAGKYPARSLYEHVNTSQREIIPIRFGRYVGDPEYGFDPTALVNPQLVITWAKDDQHDSDSVYLAVHLKLVEDLPAPRQMLAWEGVQTFVSAAEGDEPVDLPVDNTKRTLVVRAWDGTYNTVQIVTNLKLDYDRGKFIPIDLESWDFARRMEQWWPRVSYNKRDLCDWGDRRETWMAVVAQINVRGSIGYIIEITHAESEGYSARGVSNDGTLTDGLEYLVEISGHGPENTYAYPFGNRDDPGTWFNARDYKSVRLLLTQGIADASVAVFEEHVRELP